MSPSTHNSALPLMAARVAPCLSYLLDLHCNVRARVCVCVFMVEPVEVFIVWLL